MKLLLLLGMVGLTAFASAKNDLDGELDGLYKYVKKTASFVDEWGISLDSLWWQGSVDGIELGEEVIVERTGFDPVTGIYDEVTKNSKIKSPHFTFDSGFRFSLAHDLVDSVCHLAFSWTQFYTSASVKGTSDLDMSSSENTYKAFVPYWESLARNFPDSCHGKWKLELDLFDFSAGRCFNFSECFILRPHIGVRCARVRQHYHVSSHANHTGDFNGASYVYNSNVDATCNFLGVGPRAGCDADVSIGAGFSVFGAASASLVYGKFDAHSKEKFENFDFFYNKFEFYEDTTKGESHYCARAITELSFGLKWKSHFCIRRWDFPIMLALAWEQQGFYDFNNFSFASDSFRNDSSSSFEFGPYANLSRHPRKHGNVYTQGLTLSTRIGF